MSDAILSFANMHVSQWLKQNLICDLLLKQCLILLASALSFFSIKLGGKTILPFYLLTDITFQRKRKSYIHF